MKKLTILFILLAFTLCTWSQTVYPVRTYTVLTPPMPYTLSGFASEPGRMQLNINVDDVSLESYPVYFRLIIKGNGIKLHTKPTMYQDPYYLDGGMHEVITGMDLEPLFNPKNLIFEGYSLREYERTGRLPEGVYQVSVELWDYFHKVNISQAMPGVAVVYLTRAPILSFPMDKDEVDIASNPNLRFSWMGSMPNDPTADPVYRFNLYEIRPEGRNPYEVVNVSPPVFTMDTDQPSLIYDMGMPPLEEGLTYAWQIQAIDLEGKAKFQNDGFSEVYSFRYGKACETPEVQITKVNTSEVHLKFSGDLNIQLYRIFYKTTDDEEWQSTETDAPIFILSELEENTGYEIKVSALCGDEESDESDPVRCKTNLDVDYTCGKIPDNFDVSNTEPLAELHRFDFFKAADFTIQASEVTGSDGRFSGSGFALVPYLGFVKFAVEFENISINADRRMTEGSVKFVYDEANGLVVALDQLGNGGDDEEEVSTDEVMADATDEQISVDEEITSIKIDGNKVTVTTDDGKTEVITVEEGQTVGVSSKTSDTVYVADTGSGQVYTAPNPSRNGATSSSVGTASQTGEYGVTAKFVPAANQLYGFDNVPKDNNKKPNNYFNINKSGDKIAWKSLASGRAEYLGVEIKGKENDTLRYIRSSGMLAPYSKGKGADQLLLTGMSEGEEEILTAASVKKENINDSTTNEILTEVGAIGLVSYAPIHKEVVLVPLNNAQCPTGVAGVKTALDKLYAPAIVSWTVRVDKNFDYDGLKSESFQTEGTGTSKYTRDMNKVIRAYEKDRGTTKDTYYLFFVKEPQTKLAGFMPLTGEYGFIFNFGNNTNVLGHELAHGAFNLRHTFSTKVDDQFAQGTTQNLMDYSNSTELWKYQWDLIHDPEKIVLALFQDEEEGAYVEEGPISEVTRFINTLRCAKNSKQSTVNVHHAFKSYSVRVGDLLEQLNRYRGSSPSIANDEFKQANLKVYIDEGITSSSSDLYLGYHNFQVSVNDYERKLARGNNSDQLVFSASGKPIIFSFPMGTDAEIQKSVLDWIERECGLKSGGNAFEAIRFDVENDDIKDLFSLSNCQLAQLNKEDRKKLISEALKKTKTFFGLGDRDSYQYLLSNLIMSTPKADVQDLVDYISGIGEELERTFVGLDPAASEVFTRGLLELAKKYWDDVAYLGNKNFYILGELWQSDNQRLYVRGICNGEPGKYEFSSQAMYIVDPLTTYEGKLSGMYETSPFDPIECRFTDGDGNLTGRQKLPAIVTKMYAINRHIEDMNELLDVAKMVILPEVSAKAFAGAKNVGETPVKLFKSFSKGLTSPYGKFLGKCGKLGYRLKMASTEVVLYTNLNVEIARFSSSGKLLTKVNPYTKAGTKIISLDDEIGYTTTANSSKTGRIELAKADDGTLFFREVVSESKLVTKLVDELDLGQFFKKVGDYEVYEKGEVFYRAIPNSHLDDLKKTGHIKVPYKPDGTTNAEIFTSPTLGYIKESPYLNESVIIKFQLKPGTIEEFKSIGRVPKDNFGDNIFVDFGELPIVEKGWMKNNTLFKIETPKTGKRQVNIGLGRDGEGMRIFNENIVNFEIIK